MKDAPDNSELPLGNADAGQPAGGGAKPPAPAVGGAGEGGTHAGEAGSGVLGSAHRSPVERPPKPKKGPGRGNTWDFEESLGEWVTVRKTDAPLDEAARKAVAAAGWGNAEGPAPAQESPRMGAAPTVVPPVFVFDDGGNRAFLLYALNSVEGARKEHLATLALSILAGTKAEDRADEFAGRFYDLEKLTEEEREGVITVLMDFLRECEVNIPKSAIGVWAVVNRSWRGYRSQKEMVEELSKLKDAAK